MSGLRAGWIGIVVVCIVTYLAFTKRLPWAGEWTVQAVVSNAVELHAGSPVRIAGVDVGSVRKVESGPGTTSVITLRIDEDGRPLHADTTLKIRPRLFLEGNFFVELHPGRPASPEMEEGATIPLTSTASAVQFDEVLGALQAPTRAQLREVVQELATALDRRGSAALRGLAHEAPGALTSSAIVAEAVRGERDGDLGATVASLADLADGLAEHDDRLGSLVGRLATTATTLGANDTQIAAALRELGALVGEAPAQLLSITSALPAIDRFAWRVTPALRAAPQTLDAGLGTLDQVRKLVAPAELPGLVTDLAPAVRSLTKAQPELTALFDDLTPVSDCLAKRVIPVLEAKVEDPPHTTGQPIWQELLAAMVGLGGASQNFDGNGNSLRYQIGAGEQLISTGTVPGVGRLYGLTAEPIAGSRPRWTGRTPPFAPRATCRDQQLVELEAQTGSAPASRRVTPRKLSPAQLRARLAKLQREAGGR